MWLSDSPATYFRKQYKNVTVAIFGLFRSFDLFLKFCSATLNKVFTFKDFWLVFFVFSSVIHKKINTTDT
jgi:hypothetical protein